VQQFLRAPLKRRKDGFFSLSTRQAVGFTFSPPLRREPQIAFFPPPCADPSYDPRKGFPPLPPAFPPRSSKPAAPSLFPTFLKRTSSLRSLHEILPLQAFFLRSPPSKGDSFSPWYHPFPDAPKREDLLFPLPTGRRRKQLFLLSPADLFPSLVRGRSFFPSFCPCLPPRVLFFSTLNF